MRHDYQVEAVKQGMDAAIAGRSLMIVSPTGSGKSYMEADLLTGLPGWYLTCPSEEIGRGIYRKMTGDDTPVNQKTLEAHNIYTVKRLHNLILAGKIALPAGLITDEAHHSVDATHSLIAEACGSVPKIGFTATMYRGTPAETAKLRERWPNVYKAITLKDAIARGVIARPDFGIWPLLNDDMIDVANGEFVVRSVDGAVAKILPDLCDRMQALHAGQWLRPTMIRVGSVNAADLVHAAMKAAGLPALVVTGETTGRNAIFDQVLSCSHALIQIKVVGEGVDLPLRCMIDLAPTLSPVYWMQAVGRITRPVGSSVPPQYICTNHNLTRHAYLWEGCIPVGQVRDAQQAWGADYRPNRRSFARALNLEGFGRFVGCEVPLMNGSRLAMYALQTKDGLIQYCVLLHPCMPEPVYFCRTNARTGVMKQGAYGEYAERAYGHWRRIDAIPDLDGYVSIKPSVITPRMFARWKQCAKRVGLDPLYVPDAREITVLFVLLDSNLRFGG